MTKKRIALYFNYGDKVVVTARNEKEAKILAQAERIKQGKPFHDVTHFVRIKD